MRQSKNKNRRKLLPSLESYLQKPKSRNRVSSKEHDGEIKKLLAEGKSPQEVNQIIASKKPKKLARREGWHEEWGWISPTEQDELNRTGKVARVIQERLFQKGELNGNTEGRSSDR